MAERPLPPHAITCLLDSLRSTQEVIRSYDTKAQIMGIIFILSINFVLTLLRELVGIGPIPPAATIGLAAMVLVPLGLFGFVLYPTNNPTTALDIEGQPIHRTYFVVQSDHGLGTYLDDIEATDWPVEIAYEIMKMARLREIKRRRLLRALLAAAVSYALILTMMAMIAG